MRMAELFIRVSERVIKMKICYVNKGINIHDQKFLKYFANEEEFDVHLLSFYGKKLPDINGLTIHQISIPTPEMAFPIASALTPLLIRKIKPDIVHGNYLLTYGFYAALAHYHPLLQMAWGSDVLIAPKNRVYRPIVKYSLKHADLVTVDCEMGKKAIVKLRYPAENILVFPWGIDIKKFNPHVDGRDIRDYLDWQDNLVVVCTRQHKPVYGLEYLINAISVVIKKEPTARFLLIGSGPLTDDLKKKVKVLKIENYVKFTGMVPNEDLPKYLAASDLYVSSSLSDGTSVCLLEAMAVGLPVVVTDVDAILEWVTEGKNGLVVPKKNPAALAKAICALLEDDNLRKKFGETNYKIAKKRASWDDNVKVLEGMYQSLAKH
jgi:glycosyltransferase involved in cell wall biosynthesis